MRFPRTAATLFFYVLWTPSLLLADAPCNERPFYEGCVKTPDLIALDNKFVDEVIAAAGSRNAAAAGLNQKGWDALQRDPHEAIRRFNQSYLVGGENVYLAWGIGVAKGMLGDHETSIRLLERALSLDPKNARLACDLGHSLVQKVIAIMRGPKTPDAEATVTQLYARAEKLYKQAAVIDPKLSLPHAQLAILHFYQGNLIEASREVKESRARGGEGLDPRFEADLEKRVNK